MIIVSIILAVRVTLLRKKRKKKIAKYLGPAIYDIATGVNFKTIVCSGGGDVFSITMNDYSRYLAICMETGVIFMFDIKKGEYLKTKFHIRHDQGQHINIH